MARKTYVQALGLVVSICVSAVKGAEYCNGEVFQPRCQAGQVVVVKNAEFGRMKVGRCIISDEFGYMGQQCRDRGVKGHIDLLCSGRQECSVTISQSLFPKHIACHPELKEYLDVEYTCHDVFRTKDRCIENNQQLISESEGFLSSDVTYRTGCGSPANPWLIQAHSGQQIQLQLVDFAHVNFSTTARSSSKCTVYATVKDMSTSVTSSVCQKRELQQDIMVSTGNQLELRILPQQAAYNHYFMFHFKVIGCQDIVVGIEESVERLDSMTSRVTCQSTGHTIVLTCKDNTWIGQRHPCPLVNTEAVALENETTISHVVAIVTVIAIAVCVSAFILCIGVLCLRRTSQPHAPGWGPHHNVRLVSLHGSDDGGKTTNKVVYDIDTELNTVGRRHARMRQLYAHTAELHPDRTAQQQHDVTNDNTPVHAARTPSHVYESPAELVHHPLLPAANQNTHNIDTSRDFRYTCRLCGLNETACIHAQLGRNVSPYNVQQSPSKSNNYSV